jgi:hypothetical protein
MPNKDLFVPNGLLEVSKGWQEVVDQSDNLAEMMEVGEAACRELERMDGFFGTRQVIVKSQRAFMVRDEVGPEAEEALDGVEFRGLTLAGWLGRISYLQIVNKGAIAWPVYDARVFDHTQEIDPGASAGLPLDGWYHDRAGRVRKPLYLPVDFIDYALAAA